MEAPESYAVSERDVESYQNDGAVLLKNVFDLKWIEMVRRGVEENLKSPSSFGESLKSNPFDDKEGAYFDDYCNWQRIEAFDCFIRHSAAAHIAAQLMKSKSSVFYHEHVLVKEPGTIKATPWHQDQPYYPVDGFQNCSLWMPLDDIDEATTVRFVRGSHRWGSRFRPRYFATESNYITVVDNEQEITGAQLDKHYEDVPVDKIEAGQWETIQWPVKPGDCVAFHMLTVHGAPGNLSPIKHRRVLSTRWLGDDAVLARRPWAASPPIHGGLTYGDRFVDKNDSLFPILWRT